MTTTPEPTADSVLLRTAMAVAGVRSVAALARILDVHERTARRWDRGESPMDGPARQLCRALILEPALAVALRVPQDFPAARG